MNTFHKVYLIYVLIFICVIVLIIEICFLIQHLKQKPFSVRDRGKIPIFCSKYKNRKTYIRKYPREKEKEFQKHVQILKYLNAKSIPFVPKILSVNHNQLEYTMEDCGEPVGTAKNKPNNLKEIMKKMCGTLKSHKIYHGDILEKNITIKSDGSIYLIDWEYVDYKQTTDFDICFQLLFMRTRKTGPNSVCIRDLCDWCLDEYGTRIGQTPKSITTVFVKADPRILKKFYQKYFGKLGQFILITGNSDRTLPNQIDERFESYIGTETVYIIKSILQSDRLLHWFAENCDEPSSKMSPIPIGIKDEDPNNFLWDIASQQIDFTKRSREVLCVHRIRDGPQWEKRKHVNFLSSTAWKDFVDIEKKIENSKFYETIRKYKFVLCVSGGGLDPSPKAWECLICGVIPIIEDNPTIEPYKNLPVIIVPEWNEESLSPEKLDEWLEKLRPHYESPSLRKATLHKLTMKYWWDQIKEVKNVSKNKSKKNP